MCTGSDHLPTHCALEHCHCLGLVVLKLVSAPIPLDGIEWIHLGPHCLRFPYITTNWQYDISWVCN